MIKNENFPNAYTEINEILKFLDNESKSKIPNDFTEMIEKKRNKNYKFEVDETKDLQNQNILRETKVILGYIFLNYLGNDEQKIKIKRTLAEDIKQEEQKKKEKYTADTFKNNNKEIIEKECEKSDNMPIPVNKQNGSIFLKLKNFISLNFLTQVKRISLLNFKISTPKLLSA